MIPVASYNVTSSGRKATPTRGPDETTRLLLMGTGIQRGHHREQLNLQFEPDRARTLREAFCMAPKVDYGGVRGGTTRCNEATARFYAGARPSDLILEEVRRFVNDQNLFRFHERRVKVDSMANHRSFRSPEGGVCCVGFPTLVVASTGTLPSFLRFTQPYMLRKQNPTELNAQHLQFTG
jgi:hypothetical protein